VSSQIKNGAILAPDLDNFAIGGSEQPGWAEVYRGGSFLHGIKTLPVAM
jgi:hypothetical protein